MPYMPLVLQVYDYVQNYSGFVDRLLHHLNTSAMMDLLLQMVAAPDTDQIRLDLAKVRCTDIVCSCVKDCTVVAK